MIRIIYCEALKIKNSIILLSTITFASIAILCKTLIFMSETNMDFTTRINIQASVMFMLIILNSVIIVNRAFHIEKDANNFQNILTNFKKRKIWISKIFILIMYEMIAFLMAQFIGSIFVGTFAYLRIFVVTIFVQAFVSIGLHILLQVQFGNLANIILGIMEIILVVFSTNIPMRNWYYFPCCYGYKIYEYFDSLTIFNWLTVIIVIITLILLNIALVPRIKK